MPKAYTNWPNGAKASVMISINLDAEYFWLSLSPDSIHHPKTLSMGEYGPNRGLERLLDVLDNFDLKATFFVPGRVAEVYPNQLLEIVKRGHEIGNHGYTHANFGLLTKNEQRNEIINGNDAIKKVSGVVPKGFRAPEGEMTHDTLSLLEELEFKYSSSLFASDLPYFLEINQTTSELIEIPLHWELNDFPYFAFNYRPAFPKGQGRIANYSQVLDIWKEEFKAYHKFGLSYVLQLDPQTIGTPGRIGLLEELLEFIMNKGQVWFCTGTELAEFWKNRNEK